MISTNKLATLTKTIAMLTLVSCTASYSFTGASIPIQAKTFSIKQFINQAPTVNPQLALLLSEKLYDRILSSTTLTADNIEGDMDFEGIITNYTVTPVALQGGDITVAAKNRLTITVKVNFRNRYEPKQNFESNFSQYEDFDTGLDLTTVEQALTEQIVEKIVTDIFNKALTSW